MEICGICGQQISAQCAKEQAECIYSPTDLSDKHRCHAYYLSITQIAPYKGKSAETEYVVFTFALAGRGVIGYGGLPRVSLRLSWAMEVIGLSARLVQQGYALP